MEKPGCRWGVTFVSMLFIVGMIFSGSQCNAMMRNEEQQREAGPTYATIGDFRISQSAVDKMASSQIDASSATPVEVATDYARALSAQVDQALLLQLAKKKNVNVTDDAILKSYGSQFDEIFPLQARSALKLPFTATDAQVNAEYKKRYGHDVSEQKKLYLDGIQKQLDDPGQRDQAVAQAADTVVSSAYENDVHVTDDQVRHINDELLTKRIYFDSTKHKGQDLQKLADQVLADIKSGKLTFEQAMDKYTDDPPAKGKPAHENQNQVAMQTLYADPDYQPLQNLKKGEISGVLPLKPSNFAIYRVEGMTNIPNPDFEKNKEQQRKQLAQSIAISQKQADLENLRKSVQIKWNDAGMELLYEFNKATTDPSFASKPIAEQHKIDQEFLDKARSGTNSSSKGAILTAAAALDPLWTTASAAEKAKLSDTRMDVLNAFLSQAESFQARIDLVNMSIDKKLGKQAFENLKAAAELNNSNMTNTGQQRFGDIAALLTKMKAANLITAEQEKTIQDDQDSWRKEKLEYDKAMEDQQKQEAEDRKRAEEEEKKAKQPVLRGGPSSSAPSVNPLQGATAPAAPPTAPATPPKPATAPPKSAPPAGKPAAPTAKPATTGH